MAQAELTSDQKAARWRQNLFGGRELAAPVASAADSMIPEMRTFYQLDSDYVDLREAIKNVSVYLRGLDIDCDEQNVVGGQIPANIPFVSRYLVNLNGCTTRRQALDRRLDDVALILEDESANVASITSYSDSVRAFSLKPVVDDRLVSQYREAPEEYIARKQLNILRDLSAKTNATSRVYETANANLREQLEFLNGIKAEEEERIRVKGAMPAVMVQSPSATAPVPVPTSALDAAAAGNLAGVTASLSSRNAPPTRPAPVPAAAGKPLTLLIKPPTLVATTETTLPVRASLKTGNLAGAAPAPLVIQTGENIAENAGQPAGELANAVPPSSIKSVFEPARASVFLGRYSNLAASPKKEVKNEKKADKVCSISLMDIGRFFSNSKIHQTAYASFSAFDPHTDISSEISKGLLSLGVDLVLAAEPVISRGVYLGVVANAWRLDAAGRKSLEHMLGWTIDSANPFVVDPNVIERVNYVNDLAYFTISTHFVAMRIAQLSGFCVSHSAVSNLMHGGHLWRLITSDPEILYSDLASEATIRELSSAKKYRLDRVAQELRDYAKKPVDCAKRAMKEAEEAKEEAEKMAKKAERAAKKAEKEATSPKKSPRKSPKKKSGKKSAKKEKGGSCPRPGAAEMPAFLALMKDSKESKAAAMPSFLQHMAKTSADLPELTVPKIEKAA